MSLRWWDEKVSVCALCGDMSEQYISLDPTARSRYLANLQILGLTEVDNPLASWNNSKFKCLPSVEYPHIFAFRPVNSTSR